MKVLHIIARFNVGGTATWISNLSNSLTSSGHESILLVGEVQRGEIEDTRIQNMKHQRIEGLGRSISPLKDLKALIGIRRFIQELSPDLINTHTAKAGILGRLANLSLGKKRVASVHTIHGHLMTGYFAKPFVALVSLVERILASRTDVLLFAGQKVMDDCLSAGIKGRGSSQVVMPGIPDLEFSPKNSTKLTVGWLARFASVKRPDRVLGIAKEFPEVAFLLGGKGPLFESIVNQAPDNCNFTGWQSPETFWSTCDIALSTSDNEALPISMIEAQLRELPCLVTPAGSSSEVVLDGENGLVARDFEVSTLVRLLKILVSDENMRKEMGRRARIRALKVFSPARQLEDHLSAYRKAIEVRGKNL